MTPEQLFLAHLPLINKVVAQICRRYHFQKEESEQFLSEVQDKIMADDYSVLRKFEGKCSLKRYLVVVIGRLMLDFQNRLWGKWRPCEMAKKLGPVAVHLDRLLHRDGYSFDEAVEILRTNHKVEMTWQELNEIAVRLPPRASRRMEGEEVLEQIPSSDDPPDNMVVQQEKSILLNRALEALQKAFTTLGAEDRLILKMWQWDHFTVAQIAKALQLDQVKSKALYKHIDKLKAHLRREMERQGIRKEDIDDLFVE
jgi:RNA polymerase sigma factor for flagellar operon FliA